MHRMTIRIIQTRTREHANTHTYTYYNPFFSRLVYVQSIYTIFHLCAHIYICVLCILFIDQFNILNG